MLQKQTIIFDLDGTLADITKRKKLATKDNRKMNWDVFFNPINIGLDEPNLPVINILKSLEKEYLICVFSGRDDISLSETTQWLNKYEIFPHILKMRDHGNYTPDDILKNTWLNELQSDGFSVMCAFDDRDKVVKMWRESGIPCMQVNYGNF
jgi:hypothetical protein